MLSHLASILGTKRNRKTIHPAAPGQPHFTAHNIRLDNGHRTMPQSADSMEHYPWFVSARRILDLVFPGDKGRYRIADLGCLEGGYAVEFARLGFQVVGIEVRESNFAACQYVKRNVDLPSLDFVRDDAWNISRYGKFDAVFCCGLLYHLDRPKKFLALLSEVTSRLLILQTHFATESANEKFKLSKLAENESHEGRWYTEYATPAEFQRRDNSKWASWDNQRSFWLRREHLLQAMADVGFDTVMEQFDGLGADIVGSMTRGYYKTDSRGTFIGVKSRG